MSTVASPVDMFSYCRRHLVEDESSYPSEEVVAKLSRVGCVEVNLKKTGIAPKQDRDNRIACP